MDPSGRVISPTQRPLPDNTQHSQQTDIHATGGFEPTITASEGPSTYALDRSSTGIGTTRIYNIKNMPQILINQISFQML